MVLAKVVVSVQTADQNSLAKDRMNRWTIIQLLALLVASLGTQAFLFAPRHWVQRPVVAQSWRRVQLSASSADLFSDDLFGDSGNDMSKKKETMPIKSKSKYLDEDWQLSPEDQKEYKGFVKKEEDATEEPSGDEEAEVAFPCFALMYRLRKEYVDTTIESVLADHNHYCTRFKRLINSEVVTLRNRKGFVLLWAGLTTSDKAETRAEIKDFVDGDPLIAKDMIEKWDIIDLESKMDKVKGKKAPLSATTAT